MRVLFFFILIAGAGNTVLRPEMENPLTLYRVIAPIGLLAIAIMRPQLVLKFFVAFALFMGYNIALATLYSGNYSELFPSLIHYFYLGILLVMMIAMKQRYHNFEDDFLRFVHWFFVFLLLNLALEFFIGSYYPNLYEDLSEDGSVRAFYWNQNDLAVVICAMTWIFLAYDRYQGWARIIVSSLTLLILYINDSKAALLSMLVVSLPVFLLLRLGRKKRRVPIAAWLAFAGCVFVSVVLILFQLRAHEIQFANQTYTLNELLFKPIIGILTLQPSGEERGSLNNRMDSSIFVIIEYLRTYGLGLGAGGSWLVLSLPQYKLGGAQSPHNALLQFVVDFGFPVLVGYIYLIIYAVRMLGKVGIDERMRLQVIAILSFPLLGLSQSGAIVTNYFFWAIVYFIWIQGRSQTLRSDIASEGI